LNVSVTLLVLKLSVESAGTALTKTGGNESLGPPVGGMMLAQEVRTRSLGIKKIMKKNIKYRFNLHSLKNQT